MILQRRLREDWVISSSALTLAACKVQVGSHEHFPFSFGLGFRLGLEVWTRDFLQPGLVVLGGLLPFLLGLEDAAEMLLGFLSDCLLAARQLHDIFSGLEGLCDDLREGLLVQVCLLCQFHVVVGDSLVEHAGHLLENFAEVLLKLRGEAVEELLHVLADLVSVDLCKIGLYFLVDAANESLQLLNLLLEFLELPHYAFELDVDEPFHELPLHFLHGLLARLQLNGGVHPSSLHLNGFFLLGSLLGVDDLVEPLLSEGRLQQFRVLHLDDFYLFLGAVERIEDGGSVVR